MDDVNDFQIDCFTKESMRKYVSNNYMGSEPLVAGSCVSCGRSCSFGCSSSCSGGCQMGCKGSCMNGKKGF